MAVSVYATLIVVALVSTLRLIGAIWDHNVKDIIKALGETALVGGIFVNFTVLPHIGQSSATLPSWVYTVPIWVGGAIFSTLHLLDLRKVMKKPSVVNNIKDFSANGP